MKYFHECSRNKQVNKRRLRQLFSASGPLDFVEMAILIPPSETLNSNQSVLVMTDRCSKLEKARPRSRTTASHTASLFMESWRIFHNILTQALANYGTQFINSVFETLCTSSRTNHLTSMAYHLQMKEQAERFYGTIVARLQSYVTRHWWDLDILGSH